MSAAYGALPRSFASDIGPPAAAPVVTLIGVEVEELIERAWKAVERAKVSETAQPVALQEAVAFLRDQDRNAGGDSGREGSIDRNRSTQSRRRTKSRETVEFDPAPSDVMGGAEADEVAEDTFFSTLASESGVADSDLRDVLLYKGGKVTVSPPTRMFGESKTAQAKAITALVAGARAKGLGESTVRAEVVHDELKRKQCWDKNNFNQHLRALRGYNVGSDRSEIVTTSKWVAEFKDAVALGVGTTDDD